MILADTSILIAYLRSADSKLVATLAQHSAAIIELWARDQHFPLIQTVLPSLRLFQEPP